MMVLHLTKKKRAGFLDDEKNEKKIKPSYNIPMIKGRRKRKKEEEKKKKRIHSVLYSFLTLK